MLRAGGVRWPAWPDYLAGCRGAYPGGYLVQGLVRRAPAQGLPLGRLNDDGDAVPGSVALRVTWPGNFYDSRDGDRICVRLVGNLTPPRIKRRTHGLKQGDHHRRTGGDPGRRFGDARRPGVSRGPTGSLQVIVSGRRVKHCRLRAKSPSSSPGWRTDGRPGWRSLT